MKKLKRKLPIVPTLSIIVVAGIGAFFAFNALAYASIDKPPLRNVQIIIIGRPNQGTHAKSDGKTWQDTNAVDYSIPKGTPVYAVEPGIITNEFGCINSTVCNQNQTSGLAGLRLNIRGEDGVGLAYYAHLSYIADGIKPGVKVSAGQYLGKSGVASGSPHLHLALKESKYGNACNALKPLAMCY
jgi:murein DD-endopeptidase MepM/ murein hydrolase activator NlpD